MRRNRRSDKSSKRKRGRKPHEHRTAACNDANTFLRNYTVKDETEAYDFLKSQGMQVNLKPDTESFRIACGPVIDKNPDLFVPELVKMARATPA